jgi:PIN domain nuclease of toxin-antitoxin system
MIIAQALGRDLTVVTRDAWFTSYGVPILRS